MTRIVCVVGAVLASSVLALADGQTTLPIAPATPDIQVPGQIALPGPAAIDELVKKPLTADDAARVALLRQQTLLIAKASVQSASGARRTAESALLPSLALESVSSSVNVITRAPANGPSPQVSNSTAQSLSLQQLLFNFSHSEDLVRQAADLEEAAKRAYEMSRNDLVNQVKQAFYTYVQDLSLIDAADANVRNTKAQVDLAQARLDSGLGAPADVVNAKTQYADAIVSLTEARQTATAARMSLATAMGLDPRTPITAATPSEERPVAEDMNSLVDQALKLRPEMAEATAVLNAAQAGLNAARTGTAPSLVFNASIDDIGTSNPFSAVDTSFGVTLSWTLYDSGYTAGKIDQAKAGVVTAKAQLDLTSQSVVGDVSLAYLNLRAAEQRAIVTTANVAVAQQGVLLAQGRYKAGVTTFLEVITAQTSLFTAQTNDVTAKAAIQQARAALARAVGKPSPAEARL
jgi:outer membrane protein TolC